MFHHENVYYRFNIPWDNNQYIDHPGRYLSNVSDQLLRKRKKPILNFLQTVFLQTILQIINDFISNYMKKSPNSCPSYTNFLEYVSFKEKRKELIESSKNAIDVLKLLAVYIVFSKDKNKF